MLERLGRYEIVEELGRGAMGVIYKAKDPAIGRFVAIKTIRLGDFSDPNQVEELRSRLKREAQSAGALLHPNIITIFDAGEEEGLSYFAMELVEGVTLEHIIETNQHLDTATVIHIARQTAEALGFAHQHGIVHRDIKPANIMLTQDGRVKVADFGIAKVGSTKMTQTGMLLGSPSYMAPEHFLGQALDGRSDIFALGIVLYELITGQPPFSAENLGTLSYKIVHEDVVPPLELRPNLNPQLNAVVVKALAREPNQRFQSAEELCIALDGIQSKPGDSSPASRAKQTLLAKANSIREAPPLTTRKGHVWLWILLLGLTILVGGGMAKLFYPEQFSSTFAPVKAKAEQLWNQLKQRVGGHRPTAPQSSSDGQQSGSADKQLPRAQTQALDENLEPLPTLLPSSDSLKPVLPKKASPDPVGSEDMPAEVPQPKSSPNLEPGTIEVSSVPAGAEIIFDDRTESSWVTPYKFENVPKGRHTLEIRKTGHLVEKRIIILLGKETQRLHVVLSLAAGILKVSTVPPGAQIFVDGELETELSPASLKIPAGARKVLLRKEGFQDVEKVIEIEDNSINTLNEPLTKKPGV